MGRWFLLAVVLWLQGCSAVKLGYQQLPNLSYWWLDSALSFSDAQTAQTKDALAQLHRWHQSEELPAYADLLKRLAAQSAEPLQAQQVCHAWDEIDKAMDRTMRQTVRLAAPVALMLGPEQLSHLNQYWIGKNKDWDKEWVQGSASERLERIGLGTPEGVVLKAEGFQARVKLDETPLKQVAEMTRGEYFRVANAKDVERIYQSISSRIVMREHQQTEVTSLVLCLGMGWLLLGAAWGLMRRGRVL
mgnify:CR=1 FL=1